MATTDSRALPALRGYQARTFLALARGLRALPAETFTVLFPRQAGKNELAAALVAWLLASNAAEGGTVVICAPTMSPQAEISIARVQSALAAIAPLANGARPRQSGAVLRFGRASAVFLSASPEAHVAGHTASLALIADEAQEIDEEWFDRQFRPMTAATAAPIVLFGTPWNGETLLDRAVERNRALDAAGQARDGTSWLPRHHETPWREVADAVPAYGLHVRRERERLGAGHVNFLTQYELRTVAAAGRLLNEAALATMEGSHEPLATPLLTERYVGGLDLAGESGRGDRSVLTIARLLDGRAEVVCFRVWHGAGFEDVHDDVVALAAAWRLERLVCDASGLGAPIVARIEGVLSANRVERFVFSASSKSALGFQLQAEARGGRVRLPLLRPGDTEGMQARQELRQCLADFRTPGRVRWEAPAGGHDDYVVSVALATRAALTAGAPRVAVGRARRE